MCLKGCRLSQLEQHFDDIFSAGYSVSLFTDWQSDSINEVWIKTLEEDLQHDGKADVLRSSRRYQKHAPDS